VLKNKDFIYSKVLSWCSKLLSFISFHKYHKRHEGTIFHTVALQVLLGSIQVNYSSKHNPRQLKLIDQNIPNGTSYLTMKKNMVHGLSIPSTHTTPINHNDALLLEIVHDKDFS
jgi:hypothetical protein